MDTQWNEITISFAQKQGVGFAFTFDSTIAVPDATGILRLDPTSPQLTRYTEMLEDDRLTDADVQDLGGLLFRRLFQENAGLLEAYHSNRADGAAVQNGVRILLRFLSESQELSAIPWEFMYDPGSQEWLGAGRIFLLSRYIDAQAPQAINHVDPLRLLTAVASPDRLEPVNAENEISRMESALATVDAGGHLSHRVLTHTTRESLHAALTEHKPHIVHFIGHGRRAGQMSGIILEDPSSGADFLDEELLLQLMRLFPSIIFVVLAACESTGTAVRLAKGGIPALGMTHRIRDDAARCFSEAFYTTLAAGQPVDMAVSLARTKTRLSFSSWRDWGLPALFLPKGVAISLDANSKPSPALPPIPDNDTPYSTEIPRPPILTRRRLGVLTLVAAVILLAIAGLRLSDYFLAPAANPDMIMIPGDVISSGAEDTPLLRLLRSYATIDNLEVLLEEPPQRKSLARGFFIDRTEVSNRDYGRFLDHVASRGDAKYHHVRQPADHDHTPTLWQDEKFNAPDQPVVGLSWYSAYAYAEWAGKRLPTNDEWERAARGVDGRLFPWGDTFNVDLCNSAGSPYFQTVAVDAYPTGAAPDGVLNMCGNAAEWTADSTLMEDAEFRGVRGGSWNEARELGALAYRYKWAEPGVQAKTLGFRCASDIDIDGMIAISPGEFITGAYDESYTLRVARDLNLSGSLLQRLIAQEPGHVSVDSFYIDKFEVTNGAYRQFLDAVETEGDDAYRHPSQPSGKDHTPDLWGTPSFDGPRQPVVGIDWYDAYAFAAWTGKRLPTIDEWRLAAYGPEGRRYPWGDEYDKNKCNAGESPHQSTVAIDEYPEGQSSQGAYNMVGNAAEWVATSALYDGSPGYAICGGSWKWLGRYRGLSCYRDAAPTTYRGSEIGFRCASDIAASTPSPGPPIATWLLFVLSVLGIVIGGGLIRR